MICPYCNIPAEWVNNSIIYGKTYGNSYMLWLCKKCGASVGCHNNTKKPLGAMANKQLKKWRILTHRVFDTLWESGKINRDKAYKILSDHFGRQIHIGESDIDTCKAIIKLVKDGKIS